MVLEVSVSPNPRQTLRRVLLVVIASLVTASVVGEVGPSVVAQPNRRAPAVTSHAGIDPGSWRGWVAWEWRSDPTPDQDGGVIDSVDRGWFVDTSAASTAIHFRVDSYFFRRIGGAPGDDCYWQWEVAATGKRGSGDAAVNPGDASYWDPPPFQPVTPAIEWHPTSFAPSEFTRHGTFHFQACEGKPPRRESDFLLPGEALGQPAFLPASFEALPVTATFSGVVSYGSLPAASYTVCMTRSTIDTDGDGLPDPVDLAPKAAAGALDLGIPGGPPSKVIPKRLEYGPGGLAFRGGPPKCPGGPATPECTTAVSLEATWEPWTKALSFEAKPTGGAGLRYTWSYDDDADDAPARTTRGRKVRHDYAEAGEVSPAVVVTSALNPDCAPLGASVTIVVDPINHYTPTIQFHPKEKYFGGDPNDFILDATLRYEDGKGGCKDRDLAGHVDQPNLPELDPRLLGTQAGTSAYRVKNCPWTDDIDVPFPRVNEDYTVVKKGDDPDQGYVLDLRNDEGLREGGTNSVLYAEWFDPRGKSPYIIYWLFYPHNHWRSLALDEVHEGDWEHVVVMVDQDDLAAKKVAFYQHYCLPDVRKFEKLTVDEQGHFVVFAAKGGHASFPDGRRGPRNSCIQDRKGGWDYARAGGRQWRPWNIGGTLNAAEQPWYGFGGSWGDRSDDSDPGKFDNFGPPGPGPQKSVQVDGSIEKGAGETVPTGWR